MNCIALINHHISQRIFRENDKLILGELNAGGKQITVYSDKKILVR